MKNAVFCVVTPCGSCKKRRFEELVASIIRVKRTGETVMMEVIYFPEMSVLTRVTRRNIPEDDIPHNRRRESLKSYIALTGWSL
jgi:hypothetical protein